jgi:transcriptional antiterminator RfaH
MGTDITHNNSSLWYVIRTKPGDEHHVEANLQKQSIEVFLPLVEAYRNNHGKMVRVTKPLFPCYIFARLNL